MFLDFRFKCQARDRLRAPPALLNQYSCVAEQLIRTRVVSAAWRACRTAGVYANVGVDSDTCWYTFARSGHQLHNYPAHQLNEIELT